MKQLLPLFVALTGFSFALQASAHGIWFAQRAGELAMIYGHGAEDLDMLKRQSKVQNVAAFDAAGAAVQTTLKVAGPLLLVDTQNRPAVLAGMLDNGYWTEGADGKWVNKSRDEVPGAKKSGRYIKYAVHLRAALTAPLGALPGHTLQIVPVATKLPDHKDQPIRLRVLFNGKPVAGAKVLQDYVNDPDATPLTTAQDGTVTLNVRNQGLNVITAAYESPPDDPAKADKTGHFASLSFVLEHAPE